MKRVLYITLKALNKISKLTNEKTSIENGGVMFGRMNPSWVKIYDVSDAGEKAKRTNYGITFDTQYLLGVAEEQKKNDFFVMGTWHSHPTGASIKPSITDVKTMIRITSYYEFMYRPVFCISMWNEQLILKFFEINVQGSVEMIEYQVLI